MNTWIILNKIIYTNYQMPLRYGKRSRRGRKPRKLRRKRRGRKMRRMRRGNKKLRSLKSALYKDGKKITTIIKSAIRVTSKPGQCNYVVLGHDPQQIAFNNNAGGPVKAPFMGDMSFYGYEDMIEAMSNVYNSTWFNQQGSTGGNDNQSGFVSLPFTTGAANNLDAGETITNIPTASIDVPLQTDLKTIIGKNYYNLIVKSAITGANCFITLYKVKARFDIMKASLWSASRAGSTQNVLVSEDPISNLQKQSMLQGIQSNKSSQLNLVLNSVQNLHKASWIYQYGNSNALGVTQTSKTNFAEMSIADLQTEWYSAQEGTSLYDNKMFLKFFKIVKKYNAELMPGQKAKLSMKQKPRFFNPVKDILGFNNTIAKKGQVFFVLRLQGAWGHEALGHSAGDQNGTTLATNSFYKGELSRPRIGLMPAAVDVVCMKKLKSCSKIMPKDVVRQIVKVNDYYDLDEATTLSSQFFRDSAPSDYNASAAVIN